MFKRGVQIQYLRKTSVIYFFSIGRPDNEDEYHLNEIILFRNYSKQLKDFTKNIQTLTPVLCKVNNTKVNNDPIISLFTFLIENYQ